MGRYAEVPRGTISLRRQASSRARLAVWKLRQPRFAPGDQRGGYAVYHKFGIHTIRPNRGWRYWRWVTPPLHIAFSENAIYDKAMKLL